MKEYNIIVCKKKKKTLNKQRHKNVNINSLCTKFSNLSAWNNLRQVNMPLKSTNQSIDNLEAKVKADFMLTKQRNRVK